MATIQDVARRARVSAATVSRVLNSSSTVHPDLVRRVRAAVEALSYQPNGVARRLRRRESPLWAVIVPDVGNPILHLDGPRRGGRRTGQRLLGGPLQH
jgi:LacI family transcriptional regulator